MVILCLIIVIVIFSWRVELIDLPFARLLKQVFSMPKTNKSGRQLSRAAETRKQSTSKAKSKSAPRKRTSGGRITTSSPENSTATTSASPFIPISASSSSSLPAASSVCLSPSLPLPTSSSQSSLPESSASSVPVPVPVPAPVSNLTPRTPTVSTSSLGPCTTPAYSVFTPSRGNNSLSSSSLSSRSNSARRLNDTSWLDDSVDLLETGSEGTLLRQEIILQFFTDISNRLEKIERRLQTIAEAQVQAHSGAQNPEVLDSIASSVAVIRGTLRSDRLRGEDEKFIKARCKELFLNPLCPVKFISAAHNFNSWIDEVVTSNNTVAPWAVGKVFIVRSK